jgi:uncharacterized membrane protein YjjP (DUF1212 family)
MTDIEQLAPEKVINNVLEIGVTLLESGAHCGRVERNVKRVADAAGCNAELIITYTGISASVTNKNNHFQRATLDKKVKHHGANFSVLTGISLLTWDYFDKKIDFNTFEKRIKEVKNTPRHNVWLIRAAVGLACACLCLLSKGDLIDAGFAFTAAFVGLIVKQQFIAHRFNVMMANLSAAFVTSMISGLGVEVGWGAQPEVAVATAVLYLVPGIPLINCIIDIFEGFIPIALARGIFGAFVLLCIALGMFLSMAVYGIGNF